MCHFLALHKPFIFHSVFWRCKCIYSFYKSTFSPLQKHARRVYEILRLRATDMSDEEQAREYRLEVKKRLFGPYRVRQIRLVYITLWKVYNGAKAANKHNCLCCSRTIAQCASLYRLCSLFMAVCSIHPNPLLLLCVTVYHDTI